VATLLFLAFALAADAFAVALAQGACARGPTAGLALRVGLAFGVAQGVMPLIGWSVGRWMQGAIGAWHVWLAFAILLVLGARMLATGLRHGTDKAEPPTLTAASWTLASLAVATSIDAAAAGLTFDALGMAPLGAAVLIALVTAGLSALGVMIGQAASARLGGGGELLGGAVLIAIAIKVLVDAGVWGG
jgi:manganese efflux pump family protein